MTTPSPNERPNQKLTAGRDATQVGGNYQQTTNFNFVFLIIGVLALGGLAWGLYIAGSIPNLGGNVEQQQTESAPASAPAVEAAQE